MKLMNTLRNGVAGALIASLPVTAAVASTRPASAVPVAGSTAVAAQVYDDGYNARPAIAWPAVAVMVAALAVAIWIVIDDDDDVEVELTRG